MNFFEFLSTEFAACLKPPAEIIIVKRLIQRHNNVARVWVEPRSYDQSHRKNDGFITIPASLSTLLNSSSPHSKLQQKRHGTISLYLMIELDNGLLRSRISTSWWRHVIFQMFRSQCQGLMLGMLQKNLSPIAIKFLLSFLALRIILVEKDG